MRVYRLGELREDAGGLHEALAAANVGHGPVAVDQQAGTLVQLIHLGEDSRR